MTHECDIYLQARDDDSIVEPLVKLFAPYASPRIHKPELVTKSVEPISIVLTIVSTVGIASWAARRYILDPLADRAEEWWNGVSFLWKESGTKRKLSIVVNFDFPSDSFRVTIDETTDPEALKSVWSLVTGAFETYQNARARGIRLDRIRMLPDGTSTMLVIGYEGNRPAFTADLKSGVLRPIESASTNEDQVNNDIWMLGTKIQRYDYIKMLLERGYDVSDKELGELEKEIESKKRQLSE
jgi:hypothetical protein